jgi:hypothetical protein
MSMPWASQCLCWKTDPAPLLVLRGFYTLNIGLKLEKVSYGATYIRKPFCRAFFRDFAANFAENEVWSLFESLLKIRLATELTLYNLS